MGAPKGNKNALKHGLYAKEISEEDQKELRKMPPKDFEHEIRMMRVAIKNTFELQMELREEIRSQKGKARLEKIEALGRITNSLAAAVAGLSTLARTHALINGRDESINNPLTEALMQLPIFLDMPHLIDSRSAAEEMEEVVVEWTDSPSE